MDDEIRTKVKRFEDLIAYKIYPVSRKGEFAKDFRLSSQIQSAAVSMMSNVAEGFERGRLGESINFYRRQRLLAQNSLHSST